MENGRFGRMGRAVSVFIIITTGKHAGSVLVYYHLPVIVCENPLSILEPKSLEIGNIGLKLMIQILGSPLLTFEKGRSLFVQKSPLRRPHKTTFSTTHVLYKHTHTKVYYCRKKEVFQVCFKKLCSIGGSCVGCCVCRFYNIMCWF